MGHCRDYEGVVDRATADPQLGELCGEGCSAGFVEEPAVREVDREQLAAAVFEWIEAWYNPHRRHSYCRMLSPADYEAAHAA